MSFSVIVSLYTYYEKFQVEIVVNLSKRLNFTKIYVIINIKLWGGT